MTSLTGGERKTIVPLGTWGHIFVFNRSELNYRITKACLVDNGILNSSNNSYRMLTCHSL